MAAPSPDTSRALAQSAADFNAADAELREVGPGASDALIQQRATAYVITRLTHAENIEQAELEIREASPAEG